MFNVSDDGACPEPVLANTRVASMVSNGSKKPRRFSHRGLASIFASIAAVGSPPAAAPPPPTAGAAAAAACCSSASASAANETSPSSSSSSSYSSAPSSALAVSVHGRAKKRQLSYKVGFQWLFPEPGLVKPVRLVDANARERNVAQRDCDEQRGKYPQALLHPPSGLRRRLRRRPCLCETRRVCGEFN